MTDAILLIDQTIAEAACLRVSWDQLLKQLEIMSTMSLACHDIWLNDWLYYRQKVIPRGVGPWRARIGPYIEQVEAAYHSGFEKIVIVYEPQSGDDLDENLGLVLNAAGRLNLAISLEIKNASALSLQKILDLFASLAAFDIHSFVYCDAQSKMDPFITSAIFDKLLQAKGLRLEFRAHNKYGLATANCVAAIQAGVKIVHTSVAGIGTSGHPAYEEVEMSMRQVDAAYWARTPKLAETCHAVLECMGVKTPLSKAIIGKDIFAHESGIHAAGVLKRPELYEAFSPEEVGLSRRLVIGKHSGKASLSEKLKQENIVLHPAQAELLLAKVRQVAVEQKSALTDEQVKQLYYDCVMQWAEGF